MSLKPFAPMILSGKKITSRESMFPLTCTEFLNLVAPHQHKLFNFISKALNFSEDADDVYQETLLRAYKYRKNIRKQGSLKNWLFTVGNNEIRRYYNKTKQAGPKEFSGIIEELAAPDDESAKIQDIYEVAAGFKEKWRRVFYLFYYNKFTLREIAGITGIREGNLKFILNQCREEIKIKIRSEF